MKENIYDRSQKYLWEQSVLFLRQKYIEKIKEQSERGNILVLQWQRRVGKSYSLLGFLRHYAIPLDSVFYINKELDVYDELRDSRDLQTFFDTLSETHTFEYIIIDEVQNIESWEKCLLALFTLKKYKIIITGSNSRLLSSELSTLLTGRFVTLEILAFDYREFLDIRWLTADLDSFREYITFGGMPEVLLMNQETLKQNYIQNTLDSIILKDVVDRYGIKNIRLLEKVLHFLQSELGNIVSLTNITNYLKNTFKKEISLTTISSYIKYLTYPYIIREVSRYDIRGKKILDYTAKYYFTDIGIRNRYGFQFAQDIGKVLENLVYLKLVSDGFSVSVGEIAGREIDFVAERWGERLYVQVCYLLATPEVVEREFWNLLTLPDNYEKRVVSMDTTFWNTYQWIGHQNIIDFLLE